MTNLQQHASLTEELAQRRSIIHVDLDCFYCQVEQLRLGISPDVPLAVQQWQGLIATNYPARARGVKRLDTVAEAREKCPEMQFVHVATFAGTDPPAYHQSPSAATHKVSLDQYRRTSRRIMEVFRGLCPVMSKASIDEAYMDVSATVNEAIASDFAEGKLEWASNEDTARAGEMLNGTSDLPLPTPAVRWATQSRKGKAQETTELLGGVTRYGVLAGEDPPLVSYGWGDLQLQYAAQYAASVRGALYQELGYRCSAGIAHNKLLAKISSSLNKPNQQTVMLESQAASFMRTYPLTAVPSLGGKLGSFVELAFDVQTAGDMAQYTVEQMEHKMGREQAQHVLDRCRGLDDSPVEDRSGDEGPQTLTSAKGFMRYPVGSMAALDQWITMNGTDLWMRTLEEWEIRRRWPRSLGVGFTTAGQSLRTRTVPFPSRFLASVQHSPEAVVAAARQCLEQQQGLFPLLGFSLTAKGMQKETANASMMEKWLRKPATKPPEGDDVEMEDPKMVESPMHQPPPLEPSVSRLRIHQGGSLSEYETASSDSDLSCLRTPQESGSEEEEEDEEEEEEEILSEEEEDESSKRMSSTSVGSQSRTSSGPYSDENPPPLDDHNSRATTVASRRKTSVYIQNNADMDSAARYGEGYKHMNIDKHDDGSLVVDGAQQEETDGFIPALIAATRRKREIQIFKFQHSVDDPDGAIGGQKPMAGSPSVNKSSSHSRAASAVENKPDDTVMDMAVTAMMDSLSSSQAVMQIRCSQCPESAAAIASSEWETHRDWHMARKLQEREMKHQDVVQHLQRAFNSSGSSTPVKKRARYEEGGGLKQQTIAEAWRQPNAEP